MGKHRAVPTTTSPHFSGRIVRNVPETNIAHSGLASQYSSKSFEGACADTGAQKSVCGLAQAKEYCRTSKQPFRLVASPYSYKFGDGIRASLCRIDVRMGISKGYFLQFWVDVVDADIPLLLGQDLLDKHKLVADNVENVLHSKKEGWTIPIVRAHGHLFVRWGVKNGDVYACGA